MTGTVKRLGFVQLTFPIAVCEIDPLLSISGLLLAVLDCAGGAGCSCALAALLVSAGFGAGESAGEKGAGQEGKKLFGLVLVPEPAMSNVAPRGLPESGLLLSSPFPPPGPGPGMASTKEAAEAAMEAAVAASAAAAARWALAILALALTSAKVLAPVLLMIGKGGLGETWLADSNAGDPWILETWIWKRGKCINKLQGKAPLTHVSYLGTKQETQEKMSLMSVSSKENTHHLVGRQIKLNTLNSLMPIYSFKRLLK